MSDSETSSDDVRRHLYSGGLDELEDLRCAFVNQAGVTTYREPRGFMHVVDYDAKLFSSIFVCFTCTGTVFRRPRLWIELLLLLALFLLVGGYSWHHKSDLLGSDIHNSPLPEKLSAVAAFLLAFYTSLCVSRWWNLRTDGINNMMQTTSELTLYLCTFITQDKQVLSAICRYARASLEIILMERLYRDADQVLDDLDYLTKINILTEDEVQALRECGGNPAEAIWAWSFQIVNNLIKAGLIPNVPLQCTIIGIVNKGRASVALIRNLLDCPVPMPYVHLLGVLVKLSNICSAFTYGVMWGLHGRDTKHGVPFALDLAFTVGRALLVPMMFNAILTINADLSDPFSADVNNFPIRKYQLTMESDSECYVRAAQTLPSWLTNAYPKTRNGRTGNVESNDEGEGD